MIEENGVLVVNPRALRVRVERDAADRVEFAMRVFVLHVRTHFENEHAAVTVERNLHWFLNIGVGQDGFEMETGVEKELLLLLGGREWHHGWLGREVGAGKRIADAGD